MTVSDGIKLNQTKLDELVVQRMFNKWTVQLIKELLEGPKRPCQLYKALPGISSKVLNQRLKSLRDSGIIIQEKHADRKLHTEYRLSELGRSFEVVINEIEKFAHLMIKQEEQNSLPASMPDSEIPTFPLTTEV